MNRSDWLTDELIEAVFERRAGRAAPGDLRETILTSSGASNQRAPWRLQFRSTMPNPLLRPTWLKGIAAVTVVGVVAVGAALFVTRPEQPAVGGPSPTPNVPFSPSTPASPSASPSGAVIAPRAATWTATGNMPFSGRTAMLLPDGRVFTLGDGGDAALYDPRTGTWTSSTIAPWPANAATLLADGKVLVTGGTAAAEVYDPVSGTSTVTGAMDPARYGHSATLLADGRVLVAGGTGTTVHLLASAELYDPVSGTWTVTGAMHVPRGFHAAMLLRSGKVLVMGGTDNAGTLASAELYDPISGTWTATGRMVEVLSDRYSATLLADGKVLVAGGQEISGFHLASASAELYDPQLGAWSAVQGMLETRMDHIAVLLPDGRVLVAGGVGADASAGGVDELLRSAELYDPASGTWSATASMVAVGAGMATLLPDGRVLVAGGLGGEPPSAELYDPGSGN